METCEQAVISPCADMCMADPSCQTLWYCGGKARLRRACVIWDLFHGLPQGKSVCVHPLFTQSISMVQDCCVAWP